MNAIAPQPQIDLDMTRQFLGAFGLRQTPIHCRTYDDAKRSRKSLTGKFHGKIDEIEHQLTSKNSAGAGIFMVVNEGGQKAADITRIRALFVDLDDPAKRLWNHSFAKPDIVVESSPERFHLYWLVQDCPIDKFTVWQKHLANLLGGDPSVSDLPRIMRLPGFIHRKNPAQPFLTRVRG